MSGLDHYRHLRDSLRRIIELMRAGQMKTLEGPQLENDTTELSLRLNEQSLEAVERAIARLEDRDA